ncbi:MAG: hypothetical protein K6B74_02475 [Ruminococcus sp.]|nr:hypothetical protein [Ruminococcus sp.]
MQNKDLDTEKLRRSQPVRSAELDRRLLERAEKLSEGRKTVGTDSAKTGFFVLNAKEDNTMDRNTKMIEVRSRKPAAFAAAAAALVLMVGGAVYASNKSTSNIDIDTPASQSETDETPAKEPEEEKIFVEPKEWAKSYLEQNNDTYGYISIPGIEYKDGSKVIDYPVAISADFDFYITHAFDKTEADGGCICADYSALDGSQPQIVQLFGSAVNCDFEWLLDNNKWTFAPAEGADTSKPSFAALQVYTTMEALTQAPIIEFKTVWQDGGEYAVIGCTQVEGDVMGIGKVDDIEKWANMIREQSYFDCDIECGADDEYLVLNLWDNDMTRFRVFAKKLDADDDKDKIIKSYRPKEGSGYEDLGEETADTNMVSIELPIPDNIRDMFLIEAYSGDEELSADTFADEDRKIYDSFFEVGRGDDLPNSFSLAIPGKGQQKVTVALIDPLSSDSTRNRVKYAVLDVDFDEGKYNVIGTVNKSGALEMFAKNPQNNIPIPLAIPDGTKSIYFDTYMDGKCVDTLYVENLSTDSAAVPNKIVLNSTGKKTVTVYARKSADKTGFEYASFDVDFDSGKLDYSENGEEKQEALTAYSEGKVRPVFIEIPVPTGYKKTVTLEAYYEDVYMGKMEYTKDSQRPFGLTLVEDGVDKISVTAVFDDKTVPDYMTMYVDFDNGTYEFTEDGEPKTGLFDQMEDE